MPEEGRSGRISFAFENPRQEQIYRRLLLIGPGLASFYRDACRLMSADSGFGSTTHLVSHLLRDIESGLRQVLEISSDKSSSNGRPTHKDTICAILQALEIPETDPIAQAWLRLPGKNNEYGLAARAHRDNLGGPRPLNDEFRQFWNEIEAVLDGVLAKFETHYSTWHDQIDRLVAITSPTQADATFVRNRIPNNLVALGHFFNPLSNPAWIELLAPEGLFDHPPEPDYDEATGSVGYWSWPQSRYLARMAGAAPNQVLKVILAIPDTKNIRVHGDFVDAVAAIPCDLAAAIVPKARTWIEKGIPGLLLPKKLGDLMASLASGSQTGPALELASVLLAPGHVRFDLWEYEQILKNNLPVLVAVAGNDTFNLLCDLLSSAVSSPQTAEKKTAEDNSRSWMSAVEEGGQNLSHSVRDYLVAAVRDAAETLARSDPEATPKLVSALRRRRFVIFRRLAHHVLRVFPDADTKHLRQTLTSRGLLNKASRWHEYSLLLRNSFNRLSTKDQQTIFAWIDKGLDPEKIRRWHLRFFGNAATEEDVVAHAKTWQRDRLQLISQHLTPDWKARLDELTRQLGPSEHPEFASYRNRGGFGYQSPEAGKDLAALSLTEIVSYLREWKPDDEWLTHSPEGLGRKLSSLVANEPERFAGGAPAFRGLDPTYVRAVMNGFEEAAKKGLRFDWAPVLGLCDWAVVQPRVIPGRNLKEQGADPNWSWTFAAISSLLLVGLESTSNAIPFSLREGVWKALEILSDTPEPTAEAESEYLAADEDPIRIARSTERPKAMNAVIAYALWVAQQGDHRPEKGSEQPQIETMLEVKRVLERHLDSRFDSSQAVRSVYGQRFPQLVELDASWAKQNVSKIFPAAPQESSLRDAAWNSYLVYWNPSGLLLDMLREEYARAITRLTGLPHKLKYPQDPEGRLGEHLLWLYGWGRLELDDPLLADFFSEVPDNISGLAFHSIGFGFYRDKGPVSPDVIQRFQTLWHQRVQSFQINRVRRGHETELAAFGWWFVSEKFDTDWSLNQLADILRISSTIEVDHLVAERLAKLTDDKPAKVMECLTLLIDGAKEYAVEGWRQHAQAALSSALKSDDVKAKADAVSLINRLDARGYYGFRDLLKER